MAGERGDRGDADLAARLAAFLAPHFQAAGGVRIEGLQRVGGGMSTENWLFDAHWAGPDGPRHEPLVLRRSAERGIVEATRGDEFRLLGALAAQRLPVPAVHALDDDGQAFVRPAMVMQRCAGRTERHLLTERNPLGLNQAQRVQLAQQMTDVLADIHAVPLSALPFDRAADGGPPAEREIDGQWAVIERDSLADEPELVLAWRWLHAHRPAAPACETLVHGDFRPANVLVADGRLSAVLDWELAHAGDPLEDLGWVLATVYRHEHFITGAWAPADFVRRYEARRGVQVDRAALAFWSVFAVFKLTVIACQSMRGLAAGDAARLGPPPYRLVATLMRELAAPPRP